MVARELDASSRRSPPAGRPRRRPRAAAAARPGPRRSSPTPTARRALAWERVPFRAVPYAEDQRLAPDMLRAGFAKASSRTPRSSTRTTTRRSTCSAAPSTSSGRCARSTAPRAARAARRCSGASAREVRADRALRRAADAAGPGAPALRYHRLRALGAALGTRADRLPAGVRRRAVARGSRDLRATARDRLVRFRLVVACGRFANLPRRAVLTLAVPRPARGRSSAPLRSRCALTPLGRRLGLAPRLWTRAHGALAGTAATARRSPS